MEKLLKFLFALDWWVALGTLGYGLYQKDALIIAVGLFSTGLAWYKPAKKIKALMERKLLSKRKVKDESAILEAEDAFYQAVLAEEATAQPAAPSYRTATLAYGVTYLSGSKHNRLNTPSYLELSGTSSTPSYC